MRRSKIGAKETAGGNKLMCSRFGIVLGLILVFAMYSCHGKAQVLSPTLPNSSEYSAKLRRNIRKANASENSPVRTPWKNPTILIQLDTTSIILADGTRKKTRHFDLGKDLAMLPNAAWPLGRVVILSRGSRTVPIVPLQGAVPPNIVPDPRLTEADKRTATIEHMLELLGLDVVAGPVG